MDILNAYVAGLFDGEGCVSSSIQWIKGKYEKYPRVQVQVSITNQNEECLELVQDEFGGSIILNDLSSNDCFVWKLVGKRPMRTFLEAILPYTIVKTYQIKLALTFIETLREKNLGCVALSEDVHNLRLEIHNALRLAKKKHLVS